MKDNRGITLLELVIAIAILSIILLSIYSFYLVGIKSFTRETTTAVNQMSIRRASNDVAREIRRPREIELLNPIDSNNYSGLTLIDNDRVEIKFNHDEDNNTITKTIDRNVNDNWAERIDSFRISTVPNFSEITENNPIKKVKVTIESIESADMSSSGGKREKLETVIVIRK